MKTLALIILFMLPATFCQAQSMHEMKDQAHARYKESDKAMNTAYKLLITVLNKEGVKRLKISQRAWITFRDAQAAFDCHHFDGGSAEGLERLGSLDLLTKARTKRLLDDHKHFKDMY